MLLCYLFSFIVLSWGRLRHSGMQYFIPSNSNFGQVPHIHPRPLSPTTDWYIMLGVQWLKLLGSITMDYSSLTMSFAYMGWPITLCADAPLTLSPTLAQQSSRFAQTHSISVLYLSMVLHGFWNWTYTKVFTRFKWRPPMFIRQLFAHTKAIMNSTLCLSACVTHFLPFKPPWMPH